MVYITVCYKILGSRPSLHIPGWFLSTDLFLWENPAFQIRSWEKLARKKNSKKTGIFFTDELVKRIPKKLEFFLRMSS
jgi:hypothetical protein